MGVALFSDHINTPIEELVDKAVQAAKLVQVNS
jgi:hypothetical protein